MLVEVRNLTVRFGDFTAVRDVSVSVDGGEIFGFLGANGAGKTTTIRVLCGILPPTSGSVCIAGHDIQTGLNAVKEQVGYMSQRFTLYDDLTVEENLSFVAGLRGLPDAVYRRRREELLHFIGFDRKLDMLVRELPGGVKQQVSLAAAVLHDPPVVFLDEPTAGVTPAARARFWALIRSLAQGGKCLFVTTHYMDEAEQCGRIALMRAGEIIALDSPAGLKARTFPNGVLELTPRAARAAALPAGAPGVSPSNAPSGVPEADGAAAALEAAAAHPDVAAVQPYGLRYHAFVRDPARWAPLEPALAPYFTVASIAPSLEDVFIELVEGRDR
jgi:ABC-2 type transport system ATP-binding protein